MVGAAFLSGGSLRLAARPARFLSQCPMQGSVRASRGFMTTTASQGVTKDVITAGSGAKPERGQKVRGSSCARCREHDAREWILPTHMRHARRAPTLCTTLAI